MRKLIVTLGLLGSLAACGMDQRQELASHVVSQGYDNVRLTGWRYCEVGVPGQGFVAQRGGTQVSGTACMPMGHTPYLYSDEG